MLLYKTESPIVISRVLNCVAPKYKFFTLWTPWRGAEVKLYIHMELKFKLQIFLKNDGLWRKRRCNIIPPITLTAGYSRARSFLFRISVEATTENIF
jgi:hypothetical protein